jgi:hypothetical protein
MPPSLGGGQAVKTFQQLLKGRIDFLLLLFVCFLKMEADLSFQRKQSHN